MFTIGGTDFVICGGQGKTPLLPADNCNCLHPVSNMQLCSGMALIVVFFFRGCGRVFQ